MSHGIVQRYEFVFSMLFLFDERRVIELENSRQTTIRNQYEANRKRIIVQNIRVSFVQFNN